jgi:siroheme synthase-like protein
MLDGSRLHALVVGGGAVATRKIRGLLASGARVRVIALRTDPELDALAEARLGVERRAYRYEDIGEAMLVVAATDSREVNARVAADATALGRLVNVADAPLEGNCATAATHRAGDLVIAVSAGGVPTAAARVRDCIAAQYGGQFADAIATLAEIRRQTLAEDASRWSDVVQRLIGDDFCESVDSGTFAARAAACR